MVVNTSNEESEREAGAPDPRGPPPQLPAPVSKVRRINYTAKCVLLALEAKAQELQASVMCHGDPHNPNEGGSAQAKHDARTKSLEAAGVLGDPMANSHHGQLPRSVRLREPALQEFVCARGGGGGG